MANLLVHCKDDADTSRFELLSGETFERLWTHAPIQCRYVHDMAVSKDFSRMVCLHEPRSMCHCGNFSHIHIVDTNTGEVLQRNYSKVMISACICSKGKTVLTRKSNGEFTIWDMSNIYGKNQILTVLSEPVRLPNERHVDMRAFFVYDDTAFLAIASIRGRRELACWDAVTGEVVGTIDCCSNCVHRFTMDPAREIVGIVTDEWIQVYSLPSSTIISEFGDIEYCGGIQGIDFALDSSRLVTCGSEIEVRVWDVNNGALIYSHLLAQFMSQCIFLSHSRLACIVHKDLQSTLLVIDMDTSEPLFEKQGCRLIQRSPGIGTILL
jgi:WD40 repeat protein